MNHRNIVATAFSLVSDPKDIIEPVSVAEAADHLRVDRSDESNEIKSKLIAAREDVEEYTGRKLTTQTWMIYWDRWPCDRRAAFVVPFGQLQEVTSFEYRTTDGSWLSLSEDTNFVIDKVREPALLLPAYGQSWPSGTLFPASPIRAEIVCGYGDASDVPSKFKEAIKIQLGHLYSHRESVTVGNSTNIESKEVEMGFAHLLANHRVWAFR